MSDNRIMEFRFVSKTFFATTFALTVALLPLCPAPADVKRQNKDERTSQSHDDPMVRSENSARITDHIRAAGAAEKAHDVQTAAKEWSEVIRLAPNYAPAFYYRAKDYDELTRYPNAIADANAYVRLAPQDSAGWRQLGIIYADAGQIQKGLAACNRALQLNPKDVTALAFRADIYRLAKNWKEALRDADAGIRLDRRISRPHQVKGRVYAELKDYPKAIAAFSEVIKRDPSWPNPLVARGDAFLDAGDYKSALADYETAVRRFPNSSRTHQALATFLATCPDAQWRNGKRAMEEGRVACNLSGGKDAYALASLAAALAETGDFKGAIKAQNSALSQPMLIDRAEFEKDLANYKQGKPSRNKP
jgi:tetratricopeptide (TPR) repeat protein